VSIAPNDYAAIITEYRGTIRAMYEQIKSTAKFFVEVLKRHGMDNDPQIQLVLGKINEVSLNMHDSRDLHQKVLDCSKREFSFFRG
jgi:hypothetical protein